MTDEARRVQVTSFSSPPRSVLRGGAVFTSVAGARSMPCLGVGAQGLSRYVMVYLCLGFTSSQGLQLVGLLNPLRLRSLSLSL